LRFFAASPSADFSDERLDLVVSEAVRVIPMLLRDHWKIQQLLHGRQLVVRLIHSYSDGPTEFVHEREVSFDWGHLSEFLEQARE